MLNLPARLAWLADLDERAAEAKAVAEMDFGFGKVADRKVRAERARFIQKSNIAQFPTPEIVMRQRIEVERHIGPAVMFAVGLLIGCEAVFEDLHFALARAFGKCAEFCAVKGAGGASANSL